MKFNQSELETINNQSFFRIKKSVTEKLFHKFGEIIKAIKNNPHHLEFQYPERTDTTIGKITKGENYLDLPYIVNDFPRSFTKSGVFTYRIWFWWGNYTLLIWHISGEHLLRYQNHIEKRFKLFQQNDCLLAISDSEWQHDIRKNSYLDINNVTFEEFKTYISRNNYFKVVQRVNFEDMVSLKIKAIDFFELMTKNV